MKIKLPPKKNAEEKNPELEFDQLVIIGANGSGKTRFGSWIEEHNFDKVHRISAQKSLKMPEMVRPESLESAKEAFLYGGHDENKNWLQKDGRRINRWKRDLNTALLDDFSQLMVYLHTEEYNESLRYKNQGGPKPITKLDRIKKLFEILLPHRQLIYGAGIVETKPVGLGEKYKSSGMSDGERYIFYIIATVLCALPNSIIIIDEPEIHIHNVLVKRLFDLIEHERPDCSFIYLTHNLDFAYSRHSAKKIWSKSYDGKEWDYEILNEESPIPEHIYLEILGSRLPVIFTEGDNSSIDYEIYSQVFSDYTLKPVNSCNKVIQITKSFNDAYEMHHIEAFGIIDRDRREPTDINHLVSKNIWVLDVAEVENLLLIEEIVKAIAEHMGKNPDEVFNAVSKNMLDFFNKEMPSQILLFFKSILSRKYLELTEFSSKEYKDIIIEIDAKYGGIDRQKLFDEITADFIKIIDNKDYNGILRVFNLKNALIPNSKVCEETGVRNKEEYKKLLISLLKKNNDTAKKIKDAIKAKIIKTPINLPS